MDYVIGSVAALISGNVTPSRPKLIRKALTPTKHQPSPNVTPKSEFVEDRSIFLSPTQQKKKAIVKKSPKRIFQNPDLDITEDSNGDSSITSPNTGKVKKHLIEELEAIETGKNKLTNQKSPKKMLEKSSDDISLKKKPKVVDSCDDNIDKPKKKKKQRNSELNVVENDNANDVYSSVNVEHVETLATPEKRPKMKMQRRKSIVDTANTLNEEVEAPNTIISPNQKNPIPRHNIVDENKTETQKVVNKNKKNKKNKKINLTESKVPVTIENKENKIEQSLSVTQTEPSPKKKKKNRKNKSKQAKQIADNKKEENKVVDEMEVEERKEETESDSEEVKSKNIPNPNAITEKDSDSEHDSDNDIEADENEQDNSKILINQNDEQNQSSDEDEEMKSKKIDKKFEKKEVNHTVATEDEIKRTLFVGNVPFSSKCKKEIKKIFSKYGQIVTTRIRTIPVKDARVTPKLAIIKNELHPERTTVNVYIKYADPASVGMALVENNSILNNNHLRVTRSSTVGSEHDPRCAVFVGNLPFAVEDETLRSRFEKCGEVESVRIIRDKKTNAGKGFGYVNFSSKDAVELALAMSEEDLTIKNRILRVKRCTQSQSQGKWQGKPGDRGGRPGDRGKWGEQGRQGKDEGAARRIMYKRKQQDGGDGPPNKKQNITQPNKEKKSRKEFVGTTAEKKKKHKFNKSLKKKKVLSEILTKKQ